MAHDRRARLARPPGSCRPRGTKRSTASVAGRGSKRSSRRCRNPVRRKPRRDFDSVEIPDDRLRLIFTCCHPALAHESQVALTLRMLGGLETDEIARAFLVPIPTMAQRLVRAKSKIRDAGIPYVVPEKGDMPERLDAVLTVIYLVFNEGYSAMRGDTLIRTDLTTEAIRLGRLVRELMAPEPPGEATGLVCADALTRCPTHRSVRRGRRHHLARRSESRIVGSPADRRSAAAGRRSVAGRPGAVRASSGVAAEHCQAQRAEDTHWAAIVRLYDVLQSVQPSPIVARKSGGRGRHGGRTTGGTVLVEKLASELDQYHLLHAVELTCCGAWARRADAAKSYETVLQLATNESERRFLRKRLAEMSR